MAHANHPNDLLYMCIDFGWAVPLNYIAGSARGKYEANLVFWLATRADLARSGLPALIPRR